jgi:nucleotide-binding universal stress UspA family protein
MPIRDIVLHQGPDSRSEARLDIAAGLAKAHDARVIGVFVKIDPADAGGWWTGFGKNAVAEWLATLERIGGEAQEAFEQRMNEAGLDGEWRAMSGDPFDALMACARYADLTVIGQANPEEAAYDRSMPDQLVLGSGGPVLIVPYAGRFKTVGRRVMVAWNGEREAARALRDAMPILAQAETVTVYSIYAASGAHSAGADLCAYLARHGVKAEARQTVLGPESEAVSSALQTVGGFGFQQRGPWTQSRRPPVDRPDAGTALLSAVVDHGVDLLVMGAYGRSRLRELALGGTTQEILKTMTVPVLMSN